MELLPEKLERRIPRLFETEGKDEPVCQVKYFVPWSRWTFYGIEYDREERLFYGFVLSGLDTSFDELGFFSLEELEKVKGPAGLKIERDLYFTPTPLSEIRSRAIAGNPV